MLLYLNAPAPAAPENPWQGGSGLTPAGLPINSRFGSGLCCSADGSVVYAGAPDWQAKGEVYRFDSALGNFRPVKWNRTASSIYKYGETRYGDLLLCNRDASLVLVGAPDTLANGYVAGALEAYHDPAGQEATARLTSLLSYSDGSIRYGGFPSEALARGTTGADSLYYHCSNIKSGSAPVDSLCLGAIQNGAATYWTFSPFYGKAVSCSPDGRTVTVAASGTVVDVYRLDIAGGKRTLVKLRSLTLTKLAIAWSMVMPTATSLLIASRGNDQTSRLEVYDWTSGTVTVTSLPVKHASLDLTNRTDWRIDRVVTAGAWACVFVTQSSGSLKHGVNVYRKEADGTWRWAGLIENKAQAVNFGYGLALAEDADLLYLGSPNENSSTGAVYRHDLKPYA